MQDTELLEAIASRKFIVLENFIPGDIVAAARAEYYACMQSEPLHAQGEKFKPTALGTAPWRKQAIGSRSGSGEPYSQLLQTTYFSQEELRYPALSHIFSMMIHMRNRLTRMPQEFGKDLQRDPFWNACRIHHYPQGGGHMAAHRDTLFPQLLKDFSIPFLQIMVTLSQRGSDFHTGGGYVDDAQEQRHFFETESNMGSLVLFDGAAVHGVDDIDAGALLDFQSHKGRMALFVNLYKNFDVH